MAANSLIPPTPTTVSVPLKRSDRTDSCPEIDRCQLEIVRNDHPDLLTVEPAGRDRKLVSVGLFKKDKGCDLTIRVGLVAAGGLAAVGENAEHHVWDKLLPYCDDNRQPLFPRRPERLTQVRYKYRGEIISLFRYLYQVQPEGGESTSYLAITVVRGGSAFTREYQTGQSLQVYAALSEGMENLYIVTSTSVDGIHRAIAFERYTWSSAQRSWGQLYSGTVDISAYDNPQGHVTVDRSGRIYAAFSWVPQQFNSLEEDDDVCLDVWPNGSFSYRYHAGRVDYGHFYAWAIDSNQFVEVDYLSHGMTIAAGDYHIIESGWEKRSSTKRDIVGGVEQHEWYRHLWYQKYVKAYSNYEVGTVRVAGESICRVDNGVHQEYGATLDNVVESDGTNPYTTRLSFSHSGYEDQTGATSVISVGGWVFSHALLFDRRPDGNNYDQTSQGQSPIPCPSFSYDEINYWGIVSSDVDVFRSVWPMSFACHGVANTFHIADQVSGDWYAGALVNYVEDGPYEWLLYKNGESLALPGCLGNLIDRKFSALYYR